MGGRSCHRSPMSCLGGALGIVDPWLDAAFLIRPVVRSRRSRKMALSVLDSAASRLSCSGICSPLSK